MRLLLFNLTTDADAPVHGFTTLWIRALAAHCDYIDVITMTAGRIAVPENVRVYSVGREKGYRKTKRFFIFYRVLNRLLRDNHYDACFAHMQPLFAVMAAPLLYWYGVRTVLWYAHKSVTVKLRLAERVAYRVVTPSPESFRIKSDKVRVIGHGIDTDHFVPAQSPRENRPFTIVSVSRLSPIKRIETIIDAVKILRDEQSIDNLYVKLVGNVHPYDEDYAAMLRQRVVDYQLDAVIEFVPPVLLQDLPPVYHQADVFVNMSATGSIDKAVLEAMSCAVPVITSNEAFQQMLSTWGAMLLTPPDADALAQRIVALSQMPEQERKQLGDALRMIVVRDHSLQRLARMLMNIFKTGEPNIE
ncbi:MAG: glycosyltransferase [Chloroflexi bacterium]|nr:MAG: glycosyltransferase [Chloroflexota bacterium]